MNLKRFGSTKGCGAVVSGKQIGSQTQELDKKLKRVETEVRDAFKELENKLDDGYFIAQRESVSFTR